MTTTTARRTVDMPSTTLSKTRKFTAVPFNVKKTTEMMPIPKIPIKHRRIRISDIMPTPLESRSRDSPQYTGQETPQSKIPPRPFVQEPRIYTEEPEENRFEILSRSPLLPIPNLPLPVPSLPNPFIRNMERNMRDQESIETNTPTETANEVIMSILAAQKPLPPCEITNDSSKATTPPPNKIQSGRPAATTISCPVCQKSDAKGKLYGIVACKSCAKCFFRYHSTLDSLNCEGEGDELCDITKHDKHMMCNKCRVLKCIRLGMKRKIGAKNKRK